jgi:hypothetical protein
MYFSVHGLQSGFLTQPGRISLKLKEEIFANVSEDTSALIIDYFAPKTKALQSFEMLVNIYQSTRRNVPGDLSL